MTLFKRNHFTGFVLFCIAMVFTTPSFAFKTKMHIRTANLAILDAMDGGICLPGLTQDWAEKDPAKKSALPPQIPLGNTLLQHFFHSMQKDSEGKSIGVVYRTFLLHYAPYIRAGAIGPDGFPDMISGQLFVHANNSAPYECLQVTADGECTSFHTRTGDELGVPDLLTLIVGNSVVDGLLSPLYQFYPESVKGTQLFNETFSGGPQWRSVDWAHEVLYRALTYNDERLLNESGQKNLELEPRIYKMLMEQKRGAVAFAMGYFMHMIGDGNIHGVINNLVAMPWSYFGTRMPGHPVYGPLSPMQEELQHMAFERYFSDLYAPGSEPASRMKHLDGSMCAPHVDLAQITPTCMDASEIVLPPLPCNQCNPLRSVNPSTISDRCDHCFAECNPWKEICPPQLGLSKVCPASEVCPQYKATLDKCKADPAKPASEIKACRRKAQLDCTELREKCLCDKSVKVLRDINFIDAADTANYTCKSATAGKSLVDETEDFLDEYQTRIDRNLADSRLPDSLKQSLQRNVRGWQCNVLPIDQNHLLLSQQIPGGNHKVDFPKTEEDETKHEPDYEVISFDKDGYILDINENGKPDLLNECILLNCKLNSADCPWDALDSLVPESQLTDILPCQESTTVDKNGVVQPYGPAPNDSSRCDSGLQSLTSYYVAPQAVIDKYKDHVANSSSFTDDTSDPKTNRYPLEVEMFINSTYIAIPKNFVADVFYMDRRYTKMHKRPQLTTKDPKDTNNRTAVGPWTAKDFIPKYEPGTPGTFSLGGPFVNIFHAITDVMRAMSDYTRIAITDPLAYYKSKNPNSEVVQYLEEAPAKLLKGIEYLRRFARALANSKLLNFEVRNPFTGAVLVRVDIGQRMAQGMYTVASQLEYEVLNMDKRRRRLALAITAGLDRRIYRLQNHIRKKWVNTNICMAEAITTGASRFYAVDQVTSFVKEGFEIIITGAKACHKPALVDQLLNRNTSEINWDMTLVEDIVAAQTWALCEVERSIMQRFFTQVLWPAFLTLYNRLVDYYMCSVVGIPGDIKNALTDIFRQNTAAPSGLHNRLKELGVTGNMMNEPSLEASCNEAATLMFGASTALNPIASYTIGSLTTKVDTTPPMTIGELYKNLRVITQGTCWDGRRNNVHLGPRDRIRAAFGDFHFMDKDGKVPLCNEHTSWASDRIVEYVKVSVTKVTQLAKEQLTELELINPSNEEERKAKDKKKTELTSISTLTPSQMKNDPVWGPIIKAGQGDFKPKVVLYRSKISADKLLPVSDNAYRFFYKRNQYGMYPSDEFDLRPGPPIIKTLDRMMNAPDPYSPKKYIKNVYSLEDKTITEKPMHLMNSVGFEPVYNTVQINKLTFLGPGTPGQQYCEYNPYECKEDPARCEVLERECSLSQLLVGATSSTGVHALMAHANNQRPGQLGSGDPGYRTPSELFHDVEPLDLTGSGDTALRRFFQESYLSPHDYSQSHPGHRTCKDLNYNVMCNFIYDLDDPDDYCRQAHGWMFDFVENGDTETLDALRMMLEIDWWPKTDLDAYDFIDSKQADLGNYWYRFSHDNCVWVKKLDAFKLHGSKLVDKSYSPSPESIRYIPDFYSYQKGAPLREIDDKTKWSSTDHARDYVSSKRTFVLDGVVKSYPDGDPLQNEDSRIVPTRFSLANKPSHVARLYSKIIFKHYCPLDVERKDSDCDGVYDTCDNCPRVYNPSQKNTTNRAGYKFTGDACSGTIAPEAKVVTCENVPLKDAIDKANEGGCGDCGCSQVPPHPNYHLMLIGILCVMLVRRRRSND